MAAEGIIGTLFFICRFLMSMEGSGKRESQATEMVKDLAKYLHHADSSRVNTTLIISSQHVLSYLQKLREANVGPSGQVNKLQTIVTAMQWLISKLPETGATEEEKDHLHQAIACREKIRGEHYVCCNVRPFSLPMALWNTM